MQDSPVIIPVENATAESSTESAPPAAQPAVAVQPTVIYLPTVTRSLLTRTVFPVELSGYVPNPEMGWQNTYSGTPRFAETTQYTRFNWRELNPAEGVYDWSPIEDLRQNALNDGDTFQFRVRNDQPPPWGPGQVIPNWVTAQGAEIIEGAQGPEVLYSDCTFLEKYAIFVDALRQEYDGDPYLSFLDIGAYGHYGEWDTDQYEDVIGSMDWHARRRLADMYLGGSGTRPCQQPDGSIINVSYNYTGFQETQLLMPYTPWRKDTLFYAMDARSDVGIRHDALGSEMHQNKYREEIGALVEQKWRDVPIVFEFASASYSPDALVRGRAFVQEMHGSLVHDNFGGRGDDALIRAVLDVAGFKLVLEQATYTNRLTVNDPLTIDMDWINKGSAPMYKQYPLILTLVDEYGYVEWEYEVNLSNDQLMPNVPVSVHEVIALPTNLPVGNYDLQFSFAELTTWKPALMVAIEGRNADGRYSLGPLEISPAN